MKRFMAPLAVIVLAGIAPLAQATIQITYSVDGVLQPICSSVGQSVSCPDATVTNLQIINLGASSNLTGEPTLALASSSDSILHSLSGSHHIVIDVVAQGFTTPYTPPDLAFASHISTTVPVLAAASTFAFHSCVDTLDTLSGCPAVPGPPPYTSAVLNPNVATANSDNKDAPILFIPSLVAPYALDEQLDIWVGSGGRINFSGSTTLTPVPEPMSIALLGGVVLLTSRLIRRKQNQAS